jgi:hypothetical protein
MLLGMKFASKDREMFVENVAELERGGVNVRGYELQVLPGDTPETLQEAVDFAAAHFDAKFRGLHPPFPTYADDEVLKWEAVAAELGLDYTVVHAAIRKRDLTLLGPAVRSVLDRARGTVFLENIPLRGDKEAAGTVVEAALLHDSLLLDVPHTLYNWEHTRRTNVPPEVQVDLVLPLIKAVHAAENEDGMGGVPRGRGSPQLRGLMSHLFAKKELWVVAEPTGGHLNGGSGHKDTCRALWAMWQEHQDNLLNGKLTK